MTSLFAHRYRALYAAVVLRQVTMDEAWRRLDFLWRYYR